MTTQPAPRSPAAERSVSLGRITGAFGVRGEIRIESWTDPPSSIFRYQPWSLVRGEQAMQLAGVRGKAHGDSLVACVPGLVDRDAAAQMAGWEIRVARSALPPPKAGEYYWVDLQGLDVVNVEGVALGSVDSLFDTGANLVLVVRGDRERLIPFVHPHLQSVDMSARLIVVDWDADF